MDDPGKAGALGTQAAAAKPALEALELPAPGPVEFIVASGAQAPAMRRHGSAAALWLRADGCVQVLYLPTHAIERANVAKYPSRRQLSQSLSCLWLDGLDARGGRQTDTRRQRTVKIDAARHQEKANTGQWPVHSGRGMGGWNAGWKTCGSTQHEADAKERNPRPIHGCPSAPARRGRCVSNMSQQPLQPGLGPKIACLINQSRVDNRGAPADRSPASPIRAKQVVVAWRHHPPRIIISCQAGTAVSSFIACSVPSIGIAVDQAGRSPMQGCDSYITMHLRVL
ncbi:hypothetical protein PCL_01189 [Purpureocillium lilacinum]|uniref:Uncharacterized protein n=1 Tax=Purpureocillium lilacinum TaxID=33203 RepID=A0A2U3E4W2_PURLI|nr:hypothetical protein PCL_01189 [Purpureocillium lilacinum]